MILDRHNETHDLYVKALKAMEKERVEPEFHKVPDTREEVSFMKETQKEVSKSGFMFNYPQNMYETIFRRKQKLNEN